MIRESKYRYWHVVSKKMAPWEITRGYTMELMLHNPLVIAMLWTGLLDKNNKEIYEGDICCMSLGRRMPIVWKDGALGYISDYGKAWAEFHAFGGHGYLKEILGYIEVVGNIYANPELLDYETKAPE